MRLVLIVAAGVAALVSLSDPTSAADRKRPQYATVCDFIADKQSQQVYPTPEANSGADRNAFLAKYFVSYGLFDLDGDGIPEWVNPGVGGAAGGEDAYDFTLSSETGHPPHRFTIDKANIVPPEFDDEVYETGNRGERWLPYGNRIYDVFFSDQGGAFVRHALYYVHGGGYHVACVFHDSAEVAYWSSAYPPAPFADDQKALCPTTIKDMNLPSAIAPVERLTGEDAEHLPQSRMYDNQGGVYHPICDDVDVSPCNDIWRVDYDNDGKLDRLLKLTAEDDSGYGCAFQKFLLLDSRNRAVVGPKQDALANFAMGCFIDENWVLIGGRTLLRRGGGSTRGDGIDLYDDLSMVRGNDTATLCRASFRVATKVVYAEPEVK